MSKVRWLGALIAVALGGSTIAHGAAPGRNGAILFLGGSNAAKEQIFSSLPDGTHVRQLTHLSDSSASDPSWSPDGKRIAFARDWDVGKPTEHLDIYVMNTDGGMHGMGFTGLNGSPTWFPDGRRLLFGRIDGLWMVPAAGGTPRRVLRVAGGTESAVVSPDGRKVAFIRYRGNDSALVVADLGSGRLKQVTPWSVGAKPKVDWSPDGSRLLSRNQKGVFSVAVDGSGLTMLVRGGDDCSESFSPDGTKFLFVTHCSRDGKWKLYTANADGTAVTPVGNLRGHWASWGTAAG
jgi:Tol biopolymer transport system component